MLIKLRSKYSSAAGLHTHLLSLTMVATKYRNARYGLQYELILSTFKTGSVSGGY